MYILFSLHEQKIAYQNVSSLPQCHISGLQHQIRQNKLLDYSYKRKTRSVMIYTLFNCPKVDIHLDIKAEEDEKKIYTKKCEKNDIKSLKRATVKQCTKLSKTTATIFLLNSCNSFEFKSFCSRLYIHWSMSSNDISFTQIPSMYARAQHKNVLRFGRISSEFTWNDNFVPVTNTVAWCVFKFHRWRACEWVL